jgi:SpoVK/Ycf46/Vps4 family AAA+-type ATPase
MQAKVFRHTREIKLNRKGASVRLILETPGPELPPFGDRLSQEIASAVAMFASKTGELPADITLHYPLPENKDAVPHQAENPTSPGQNLMEETIPRYLLEDFISDEPFKLALQDALFYARHQQEINQLMPKRSVARGFILNFFGSSGTGKTMAAEAFANELGLKLYTMNYANVESSLVGKTPKNISEAFRSIDPAEAIIMLDEADSFVSRRVSELRQGADYALNAARAQIINEIDQFDGMIILATNLFGTYDSAILRRIKFNIFFDLPSKDMLAEMYRTFLPEDEIIPALDFSRLADRSLGLSGGDVQNICEIMVMRGFKSKLQGTPPLDQEAVEAIVP